MHLLNLVDRMCTYEMDWASIVEDTEQTWFCSQMDRQTEGQMSRWTDGWMDKVKPANPP